jgi:hypothetical protein
MAHQQHYDRRTRAKLPLEADQNAAGVSPNGDECGFDVPLRALKLLA